MVVSVLFVCTLSLAGFNLRVFNKHRHQPTLLGVVYTWSDSQGYIYKAVRVRGGLYEIFLTESQSHDINELKKHCAYSQGYFNAPLIGSLIEYFKQLEKVGP